MASSSTLKIAVLLVLSATAIPAAFSATEASPPSADCSNLILTMSDCLSFVSNGSTLKRPQGNCCGGLLTVVETNPWCLCEGFHNSAKLGVNLDVAKTKELPPLCKVPTYIIPNCDAPPPADAPSAEADATPSVTSTPTVAVISPAASAPAPAHGTSAASSLVALSTVSVAAAAAATLFLI